MRYLKQSTSADVGIGPFVDSTDGVTPETALTITQPDIRLKKNAAAWAQKAAAQTLTHEENGWYEVTLDAMDTDTIGHLLVAVNESGALPVWQEYHVLAANVYDSLFGAATDKLDVNVEEWNTTAVPAENTAGYPIVTVKDGAGVGEINTNGGKVVGVELVDVLTTYTGNTLQTGDSFDRIGVTGSGLTSLASQTSVTTIDDFLDTEIAAILAAVDSEVATIVTATAASAIRAAVGLAAADLDTQLATIDNFIDTEVALVLAAVDTEVGAIKAKTDLIPAAPAAVSDVPTAIQNADALLDRDMATGTDSGSSSVRTARQALRLLRNKWAIVAGMLTVNKEDDATASWTAVVTGTAGADPATAVDPAGP